jgi:hypothetical protein
MTKQTALEWLVKKLNLEGYDYTVEQAKEMEIKQHWATWVNGVKNSENEKLFKDYWNKTYGGDK